MVGKVIGYTEKTSKAGNIGYEIYIVKPVKNGEGYLPLTVFSNGKYGYPYLTKKKFDELFNGIDFGLESDDYEILFNEYGDVETIR